MSNFRARRFGHKPQALVKGGLKSDKRTDSRFSASTTPRLPLGLGIPKKSAVNPKKHRTRPGTGTRDTRHTKNTVSAARGNHLQGGYRGSAIPIFCSSH